MLLICIYQISQTTVCAQKSIKNKPDFNKIKEQINGLSNTDQLEEQLNSILNLDQDTVTFLKKLQAETHGYVNVNYAYGLNTLFRDSSKMIGSYFSTNGALNTQIKKLPISISYNYSSLKVPLGANNYFRITYDREKAKINREKLKVNQLEKLNESQNQLDKLNGNISELQSYLEVYLQAYQQELQAEIEKEVNNQKLQMQSRIKDSLATVDSLKSKYNYTTDSLYRANENRLNSKLDSLDIKGFESSRVLNDSISVDNPKIQRSKANIERLTDMYNKVVQLKETYDNLNTKYESARKLINYNSKDISKVGEASSKINLFDAVKKVDVGLTYPSSTGLSKQTTAVKGIGSEFQLNKFYLSFSTGLTLNNVMYSTNELNNELVYNQNSFNNFDFQRVISNGILTMVKGGYGTPDGSHIFLGINHLSNTPLQNTIPSDKKPALGLELDLKYLPPFLKGSSIDLIYGKTSINRNVDSAEISMMNSLFSNYRSHTFLTRFTQNVHKLRSQFEISYRHLDVGVNTSLFGMMQPGNSRISFESRHKITSYLRLGTIYKHDRSLDSNLHLQLNTIGGNISGAILNYITYSLNLNYVRSEIGTELGVVKQDNFLTGTAIQAHKYWKHTRGNMQVNYNQILLANLTDLNRFTQTGIAINVEQMKWSALMGYDYFFQSNSSINENTSILTLSGKYRLKKYAIDAGVKYAINRGGNTVGGHVQVNWEVYRFLEIQIAAEKFVMGNFYRNYYRTQFERFPYLIKIGAKFKI